MAPRGNKHDVRKADRGSDMNDQSRNSSAGNNEKMPTFTDSNWAYDNASRRRDSDGDYD